MTSTSYRLTVDDGFEETVRAQLASEPTGEPLFMMQRLTFDEIPVAAYPSCWSALMREQLEQQRASRGE